jgi:hypothetical protein
VLGGRFYHLAVNLFTLSYNVLQSTNVPHYQKRITEKEVVREKIANRWSHLLFEIVVSCNRRLWKGGTMKSLVALILCSAMISALPATPVDTDKDTYIPSAKQFDAAREKGVLINTVKHITHNPDQSYVGSFSAPDGAIRGITFDGTYIWAANSGDGNSTFGDKIWKVDAATGTVLGMYDGPGLGNPSGFAWDGAYLWHSDFGTDMIYKIDPVTATAVRSFPAPHGLIIDLAWDGQYLYGAAGSGDMIIKFDTISGAPLDTIYATCSSGNIAPYGLAYLPFNSGQVWTSDGNYGSNMVNEWNIAAASLIDQWAPDPAVYPCGLAYDAYE